MQHDQRVREVADLIEAAHGPVDHLITSAGILQRKLPPEDLPMAHWDAVTNIDLRGTSFSLETRPGAPLRTRRLLGRRVGLPCEPGRGL